MCPVPNQRNRVTARNNAANMAMSMLGDSALAAPILDVVDVELVIGGGGGGAGPHTAVMEIEPSGRSGLNVR